ncbi:MAG: ribonuclease H-like domain-containing protein [Nitrospirae bacterium]|nr:ribonuclease H-like domain-containing protein [Nitrospirota bacterium]
MSRIIFDIETVGKDFRELSPEVQDSFLKWIDSKEELKGIEMSLSFYPQTAEIVAIGLINPDTKRGAVYFQSDNDAILPIEENGISYKPLTEKGILIDFWDTISKYDVIVTFNGRAFDCPFILTRTAVHQLKPTKDILPNRYSNQHIDLFDQLSLFGAQRKKFNLDIWCRTLGIKSPKSEGVTGYDVKRLFKEGKFLEIAKYCAGDLWATRELFLKWETHMRFSKGY